MNDHIHILTLPLLTLLVFLHPVLCLLQGGQPWYVSLEQFILAMAYFLSWKASGWENKHWHDLKRSTADRNASSRLVVGHSCVSDDVKGMSACMVPMVGKQKSVRMACPYQIFDVWKKNQPNPPFHLVVLQSLFIHCSAELNVETVCCIRTASNGCICNSQ